MYIIIKLVDLTPDAIGQLYKMAGECRTLSEMFGGTGHLSQEKPIEILSAKQEKADKPPQKGFIVEIKLNVVTPLQCNEDGGGSLKPHRAYPALSTFAPLFALLKEHYRGVFSTENKKCLVE